MSRASRRILAAATASITIAIGSAAHAEPVNDTSGPKKEWFLEAAVGASHHRFLDTSAWAKSVTVGGGARGKDVGGLLTFRYDVGETPYHVDARTMGLGMALEVPIRPARLELGGELTHMAFRRYARDEWVGKLGFGLRLGAAVDVVTFDDLSLFLALDGRATLLGSNTDLGVSGHAGVRF